MKPAKLEYFDMHGRSLFMKFVLYYAKYFMWKEAPMTQEDIAKNKASGYLRYGTVPKLTLGDGTEMYQSNAICRFIGKKYKGMKGEQLYPPNSCPEAMHAVDELLELGTDFLGKYGSFTVDFMPGYANREQEWKDFLATGGFLEKICTKLEESHNKRGFHSPYLVTESMSIADLTMFSHFWKFLFNPQADQAIAEKWKAIIMNGKYPAVSAWIMQMNKDCEKFTAKIPSRPY